MGEELAMINKTFEGTAFSICIDVGYYMVERYYSSRSQI
jgi:hypothetical protein